MNYPKPEADRYIMPHEWQKLKEVIPENKLIFWEIILYGGLRISEALNIKLEDIDTDNIRIRTLKQKKIKIERVYYPIDFLIKLKEYVKLKKIPYNFKIFNISSRAKQKEFKKYCKMCNLNPRYSPHSLRHLHGILVADATQGDATKVAAALRHSKVETAYKYIHIAPSVRKAISEKIMEKLEKKL